MYLNKSQFLLCFGESNIFPGEVSMLILAILVIFGEGGFNSKFSTFITLGEPVGVTFVELFGVTLFERLTSSVRVFFTLTEACLSTAI